MARKVLVLPYDENWKAEFQKIKQDLLRVLSGAVLSIDHVGSTCVEGLAAKPIIDIDILIKDYNCFELVKTKLESLEYIYEGDLGIKDRQVFKYADKPHFMKHHLYVCPSYSQEYKRHIAFRDHLQKNQADMKWYGDVKLLAAKRYPEDIERYMIAKAPCVAEILQRCNHVQDD